MRKLALLLLFPILVFGQEKLDSIPFPFTAGTKAIASQVNTNFDTTLQLTNEIVDSLKERYVRYTDINNRDSTLDAIQVTRAYVDTFANNIVVDDTVKCDVLSASSYSAPSSSFDTVTASYASVDTVGIVGLEGFSNYEITSSTGGAGDSLIIRHNYFGIPKNVLTINFEDVISPFPDRYNMYIPKATMDSIKGEPSVDSLKDVKRIKFKETSGASEPMSWIIEESFLGSGNYPDTLMIKNVNGVSSITAMTMVREDWNSSEYYLHFPKLRVGSSVADITVIDTNATGDSLIFTVGGKTFAAPER